MTLIGPIRAEQGHAVTFPWCQCEESVPARPSLQSTTQPSVFPHHCFIPVNLHYFVAALCPSCGFCPVNCLQVIIIVCCLVSVFAFQCQLISPFDLGLPCAARHFVTRLKICMLGSVMMFAYWWPSSQNRWSRFIRSARVSTSHLLLSVPLCLSRFCLCVWRVIDGLFVVAIYTPLNSGYCNGGDKCWPTGQTKKEKAISPHWGHENHSETLQWDSFW